MSVERATEQSFLLCASCLTEEGAYHCRQVPMRAALESSAVCPFSPFRFGAEGAAAAAPQAIEIDFTPGRDFHREHLRGFVRLLAIPERGPAPGAGTPTPTPDCGRRLEHPVVWDVRVRLYAPSLAEPLELARSLLSLEPSGELVVRDIVDGQIRTLEVVEVGGHRWSLTLTIAGLAVWTVAKPGGEKLPKP